MKFLTSACALLLVAASNASPAPGNRGGRARAPTGNAGSSRLSTRIAEPAANKTQKMIPVVVGGTQLSFTPNQIVASPGDIVQFQFANGAHTVTQSAEGSPCVPLQDTMPNAVYSGRIPFQNGQTTVGTFNMIVNNTTPMFLYCSTGPHCQLGQVLVINPTSPDQIVNYAKKAAMATSNTDAKVVSGGTAGQIPLAQAAFVPAQPPAMAPPAAPSGMAPPAAPSGMSGMSGKAKWRRL